jgi:hypothetical protein
MSLLHLTQQIKSEPSEDEEREMHSYSGASLYFCPNDLSLSCMFAYGMKFTALRTARAQTRKLPAASWQPGILNSKASISPVGLDQ